MKAKKGQVFINDKQGSISTLWLEPVDASHLLVLGHGAGAGMEHPFMEQLSQCLAEVGIATLRYQFPYMEQGKRRPDSPKVAHETIRKVVAYAEEQTGMPLVLSGKSFGGRMASQCMSADSIPSIKALVFYGFPLHSPAKPGNERAEHLYAVKVPMLFLQGDRDALARLDLLTPVLTKLPLAHLQILPGANHGFSFTKKSGTTNQEGLDLLAHYTQQFLKKL